MKQNQLEGIAKEVEAVLLRHEISDANIRVVLGTLIQKYFQIEGADRQVNYDFEHLRTDNHKIFITSLSPSPNTLKEQGYPSSWGSIANSNSPNFGYLISNSQERWTSPMKENMSVHESRSRKKEKFKKFLLKLQECLDVCVSTIHRAFSHLAVLKIGKSAKFQVEALFLRDFKAYLENYKQRQDNIKSKDGRRSSEDTLQSSLDLLTVLCEKIPMFQSKFIDAREVVEVSPVSRLFKAPIF